MDTTRKTAWAAGFGELPMMVGSTIDIAVGAMLEDLAERLNRGDLELDDVDGKDIMVFSDVVWCIGNDGEDCTCGQNHRDADDAWLVMSYSQRRELRLKVLRPAHEYDEFDVALVPEGGA